MSLLPRISKNLTKKVAVDWHDWFRSHGVVSISRAAWVYFPVTLFLMLFLVTFTQPITGRWQVNGFLTGIFG